MGYDVNRFLDLGDLAGELQCSICLGIFEEPYMITKCGHCFCKRCILPWLSEKRTCPIDGGYLCFRNEPIPAPHIIKNIIAKQRIRCDYQDRGCEEICIVDRLSDHREKCQHRPIKILKSQAWSYVSKFFSSVFARRESHQLNQESRPVLDEIFLDRVYNQRPRFSSVNEGPAQDEFVDGETFEPHMKWLVIIAFLALMVYLLKNAEATFLTFYYDNELTCWLTLIAAVAVWRNNRNGNTVEW